MNVGPISLRRKECSRYTTIVRNVLILLAVFPIAASIFGLAADARQGIPADRQGSFATVAGILWQDAIISAPGGERGSA